MIQDLTLNISIMIITLGDEDKVPALAYKRVHKKTLYLQSSLEGGGIH